MAFDSDLQALTALVEAVRENTAELRLVKAATLEVRDLLAKPPATTNGHAQQIPLGGATNGVAPAQDVDHYGNPKVDCVRFEDRRDPAYTVRPTILDGRRPYVAVTISEYGVADAYRYACIALKAFMSSGAEHDKYVAMLPRKLRMKVELALMKPAR